MLFYYVQIKDRHDPGVNIREKASVASINEAGDSRGGDEISTRGEEWDFNEAGAGSNGHLAWLIIDLNAAKIITV